MSDHFYSSHRQPFVFYLCYGLFLVNEALFKNQWLEEKLWEWIKLELFYVDGQCQHSGNCCNELMIYKHKHPINSRSKFEGLVQKDPIYSRFIPEYKTDVKAESKSDTPIKCFSCTCLKEDNTCSSYEHRPRFCYNYPVSGLLMNGKLLEGCGYSIKRTSIRPKIRHPKLLALIWGVRVG